MDVLVTDNGITLLAALLPQHSLSCYLSHAATILGHTLLLYEAFGVTLLGELRG